MNRERVMRATPLSRRILEVLQITGVILGDFLLHVTFTLAIAFRNCTFETILYCDICNITSIF